MTTAVVEYGPARRRSPIVLAVVVLAVGGLVWLAVDAYLDSEDGSLGFSLGVLLLAALLAASGTVFWGGEPEWQGRLTISRDGVNLEQWKGDIVEPTSASWSEIVALHRWRTRRSAFYGVELMPEREGRRGAVVAVAGVGLEPQSLNPLAAMEQFAREAGYEVHHAESSKGRRGRDRWTLSSAKSDAD